jgi:hypothetical protein
MIHGESVSPIGVAPIPGFGLEFLAFAVERVIPITTPIELANRFRKNADDCDRAAVMDISRIAREQLARTAAHYRSLANQIDFRHEQTPPSWNLMPPLTGRSQ